MAKKNNFYVVWKGVKTGIFSSWEECKEQVVGYEDAKYKGFSSHKEAEIAFKGKYETFLTYKIGNKQVVDKSIRPVYKSICVDAACSGNPGKMEYRGVWTDTGKQIFLSKVFKYGTNNIGEFLAIVHALALCKSKGWNYNIFSDSINAILWLKQKKCKTKLVQNADSQELFEIIRRAEIWLADNEYDNQTIKWQTEIWGEIPADFGRK
jgi:ribonuclease HI